MRRARSARIVDVRSPAEFEQGHIPGAVNIPLFSNEERAAIGTLYKQRSRQEAVIKGLDFVSARLSRLVSEASAFAEENTVYVHCWRGGMRSGFVAMLLEMYGHKVFTLKGGYKSFRRFALDSFSLSRQFLLVGGKTGSGKTRVLEALRAKNEKVIDLEALANHKGSSFGALGEAPQPTQEQFENALAVKLFHIPATDRIWIEDESRMIGRKVIPEGVWNQMRESRIFYIELPFETRLDYIVKEYGKFNSDLLAGAIVRITKRIGPEQTKDSIAALIAGDTRNAFVHCLRYYDKTYTHGLSKREPELVTHVAAECIDPPAIADKLIQLHRSHGTH